MKILFNPKDFPKVIFPENHIASIYNQFPRRYTYDIDNYPGGFFEMIKDLPRIAGMGFNIVWINPINRPTQYEAKPERKGSLYAMAHDILFNDDFFPGIGNHEDRVKLVQEYTQTARALGMLPIFDLVLNHVGKETPLEKKFLEQGLLNTEPKNQWKDATFFYYSDIHKSQHYKVIPHEENQQNIIDQLWDPFIKRYIGFYGFAGVRVDAVINVEPTLQKKVYKLVQHYCHKFHHTNAIILGEFMAEDVYKHIDYLKELGFTHIFAPGTPYWNFYTHKLNVRYSDDNSNYENSWLIEQLQKLQVIAPVAGILGNHDLATLKAIILLRLAGVKDEDLHAAFDRLHKYLNGHEDNDLTCDTQLKQWILNIACSSNGGYYLLAGDEYGLLELPEVFDLYKKKQTVDVHWGGNKNLSNFLTCINHLLKQLPKASLGDTVAHKTIFIEQENKDNTVEKNVRVMVHIVERFAAFNEQRYILCTSEHPIEVERLIERLRPMETKSQIYFIQNNGEIADLFHFDPNQPQDKFEIINVKELILEQSQKVNAYYHIYCAAMIAGQLDEAEKALSQAKQICEQAIQINENVSLMSYYLGQINLAKGNNEEVIVSYKNALNLIENLDLLCAITEALFNKINIEHSSVFDIRALILSYCDKIIKLSTDGSDYPIIAKLIAANIYIIQDNLGLAEKYCLDCFHSIQLTKIYNIEFLKTLGDILIKLNKYDEALTCLKQLVTIDSDNPLSWNTLAQIYSKLKQYDKAQESFYSEGLAYLALEKEKEAYSAFLRASELQNNNPNLYILLGEEFFKLAYLKNSQAYTLLSQAEEEQAGTLFVQKRILLLKAETCFKLSLKFNPNSFLAFYHLGQLETLKDTSNEAKGFLLEAFSRIKDCPHISYIEQLGSYLLTQNSKEAANICYQQVLNHYQSLSNRKPEFFYPFYKIGHALIILANKDDAKKNLLHAYHLIKIREKDVDTGKMLILNNQLDYLGLGNSLMAVECYDEALKCFQQIENRLRDDLDFNLTMGKLYFGKQEFQKSEKYFDQAIKAHKILPESMQDLNVLIECNTVLAKARQNWAYKDSKPGLLNTALKFYQEAKELQIKLGQDTSELDTIIKDLMIEIKSNDVAHKKESPKATLKPSSFTFFKSKSPQIFFNKFAQSHLKQSLSNLLPVSLLDTTYWYSSEEIDKLLKLQLADEIEAKIFAGFSPLLESVDGKAAKLFQDMLDEAFKSSLPSVIPINLLRTANIDEYGLSSSLQGTHWIGVIVVPLQQDQLYTHKIMIIDSLGNGLNEDIDISKESIEAIQTQVKTDNPYSAQWQKLSELVHLIKEATGSLGFEIKTQIIVSGKSQQVNGSDCGAFVIQNLVDFVKENKLTNKSGYELRQEHNKIISGNNPNLQKFSI